MTNSSKRLQIMRSLVECGCEYYSSATHGCEHPQKEETCVFWAKTAPRCSYFDYAQRAELIHFEEKEI